MVENRILHLYIVFVINMNSVELIGLNRT